MRPFPKTMTKLYIPKTPVDRPCPYCKQVFTKIGLARHSCPMFSAKFPPLPDRRLET